MKPGFLRLFFAVSACSWVPHWACHYYRLETQSSFVVGSWSFSAGESVVSLITYSVLICLNLAAIQFNRWRLTAAGVSGIGHLILGTLHVYRVIQPFHFEVFGHFWTLGASVREALIVLPFGVASIVVAFLIARSKEPAEDSLNSDLTGRHR